MASTGARAVGTVSLRTVSLGTIGMVWQRELLRYVRTPSRIFTGLAQPLLFLFVLGYGMGSLVGTTGGLDFRKFVFPGIVAMSVVSTSIFSAISIVWDREFGFLREMLVAPAPRWALVMGKTAGGATVATGQGTIMLVLAPLVGVDLTVLTIIAVIAIEFIMAVALTAFGVFVASRITRMEGFQMVMQLVLLPMIFLSGALFPLAGLPLWLDILTRLNPLTYAVAPPALRGLLRPEPPAGRARPVPERRHAVRLDPVHLDRAGDHGGVRRRVPRSRRARVRPPDLALGSPAGT